jgi:hypothetical protein
MFARLATLFAHLQFRNATAFLLQREDDRLLADIGMSRTEFEAMHLGLDRSRLQAAVFAFPTGKALPVLFRA